MFVENEVFLRKSPFMSVEGGGDSGGAANPTTSEASGQDAGQASQGGDADGQSRPGMFETPAAPPSVNLTERLGEELGANELFKQFEGSENFEQDLAKALIEANSKAAEPVQPLGENATDEEKAAFWQSLGVPKEAADYKFAKPENWPEGLPYDEAHASAWAERMLEANVPAETANALRDAFMQEALEQHTAGAAELDKMMKEAYGDKADVRAREIGAALKSAFPDDEQVGTLADNLPESALLVIGKLQDHFKKQYGQTDDGLGDNDNQPSGLTQQEHRDEGKRVMASPEYRDPMHPNHEEAKRKAKEHYDRAAALTQ